MKSLSKVPAVPPILRIMEKACKKLGYDYEMVDRYSNNLAKISKGKKNYFANNGKVGLWPLNANFAAQMASDKAWTNKVLKREGIAVPEGDYFFLKETFKEYRGEGREIEDAFVYANRVGYPVFVKPNAASLGRLAEIIYSADQLEKHLEEIALIDDIAIIQEVVSDPEYRIFVLDGEVQYVYHRKPSYIEGNGWSTVRQLIENINEKIDKKSCKVILNSPFLANQLKTEQLSLESVLAKRQKIRISAAANLASGGKVEECYFVGISQKTRQWAKKVSTILGLRVCGIDLFAKALDDPKTFVLIEINSNPNLAGLYNAGYQKEILRIMAKIWKKFF